MSDIEKFRQFVHNVSGDFSFSFYEGYPANKEGPHFYQRFELSHKTDCPHWLKKIRFEFKDGSLEHIEAPTK